jgi:ferredoxin
VEVCPVDCFHEDEKMLVIDPVECIDCRACIPVCPEDAIYIDRNLPESWKHYLELNRERSAQLPVLFTPKKPLNARSACRGAQPRSS